MSGPKRIGAATVSLTRRDFRAMLAEQGQQVL